MKTAIALVFALVSISSEVNAQQPQWKTRIDDSSMRAARIREGVVRFREGPRAMLPALARGTFTTVLLARDATRTENIGSDSAGTCPYRGPEVDSGFSIGWDLMAPDGARLVSAIVHLRLGDNPTSMNVSVTRTDKTTGHVATIGSQDYVQNPIPTYEVDGSVYRPGALGCAQTETDMGPALDPVLAGEVVDNARYTYAFDVRGGYGGTSGTRVYWVELVYEVL